MSFGAYWAGVACSLDRLSTPRYTRVRGVEASVSSVSFRRSVFSESLLPKIEAARFNPRPADPPAAALELLHSLTPQDDPGGARPGYRGDLVFAQTFDGTTDQKRVETFRDLYYVEHQVLDADSDDPLIEITLADVRRFWEDYGEITAQWNVEKPGGLAAKGSKGREIGATPLREIMQTLLNALPGKLQISVWPEATAIPDRVVEVRCWGASPKEALKKILEVYRLEFDPGPDLRARFYVAGTGKIGELSLGSTGDNDLEHNPDSPAGGPWAENFTADGNAYTKRPAHENPTEVVVVGARTVYDVQIDWLTPVLVYETLDPATGSPVEHVVEATPVNLTDFVQKKLPGQRRDAGLEEDFPVAQLIGMGGQARADALRVAVEPLSKEPWPGADRATRIALGEELPELQLVARALRGGEVTQAVDRLKAGPTPPVPDPASSFSSPVQPQGTLLTPDLWQRLPGLDAKDWPLALKEISEEDRRALRKLWRVYQVPKSLRRLLPIRKRAEIDHKGKRVAAMVEAFGFTSVKVRITDEDEIARRELIADRDEETGEVLKIIETETQRFEKEKDAADRAAYEEMCGEIERLRKEIDKIRRPTAGELLLLANDEDEAIESGANIAEQVLNPVGPTARFLAKVDESDDGLSTVVPGQGAEAPKKPERADLSNADRDANDLTAGRMRRLLGDFLNGIGINVLGGEDVGLDGGTSNADARATAGVDLEAREERLTKMIATLEQKKLEIEEKINPTLFANHKLGEALLQAGQERQAAGFVSGSTQQEIERRQAVVNKLQAKLKEDQETGVKVPFEETVPMIEVSRFVNLGRRRVDFRVIDAERGLIEVSDLPGWVADEDVTSLDQTTFLPMPVRLTCGTSNTVDVDESTVNEDQVPGWYMQQIAKALRAQPDAFLRLVRQVGHRLPVAVGDGQARYTFTKGDAKPRAGEAAVGPHAYRVLIEDRGHQFRLLVRLSGESNDATLRDRARAIADALLDRPEFVDAGRLIMFEPRRVALNGRQSATEIRIDSKGAGWVTEVSFQGDQAPLGDLVEGVERSRAPIRLAFGIDVEEDDE